MEAPSYPQIFLAAIESAYQYSLTASAEDTAEVVRSASLFFDGVEASLIWGELLKLLRSEFEDPNGRENLNMFAWVVQSFKINDEEMLNAPHSVRIDLCVEPVGRSSTLTIVSKQKKICSRDRFEAVRHDSRKSICLVYESRSTFQWISKGLVAQKGCPKRN